MPVGSSSKPTRTSPEGRASAGKILQLLRERENRTRAELGHLTGLSRSTITQRLDLLSSTGLVVPAESRESTGGRQPVALAFNPRAGTVLAADLGALHSRVAITDLAGSVLREETCDIAIADGPERVLAWLEGRFDALLATASDAPRRFQAVGVGLPGPVDCETGMPTAPPIMPGWDGYPVADRLRARYGVPVLVDNDANIMAIGEHWVAWRTSPHLLFIKVATGIGCGIISDGRIHRGAQGAAGDIGHIQVPGYDDVVCRCGNAGCLEAVASGRALAAHLTAVGLPAENSSDVVRHVRQGSGKAVAAVRQAGRELGVVLAAAVNFVNPDVIVIGGDMAHADEALLAGVREMIYQRSTPLATRAIRIARSSLDDRAGVIGAAVMAIEAILEPAAVDQVLSAA
jgi:predicted NBD/HSP70 family sugar kinase